MKDVESVVNIFRLFRFRSRLLTVQRCGDMLQLKRTVISLGSPTLFLAIFRHYLHNLLKICDLSSINIPCLGTKNTEPSQKQVGRVQYFKAYEVYPLIFTLTYTPFQSLKGHHCSGNNSPTSYVLAHNALDTGQTGRFPKTRPNRPSLGC